MKSFPSHVSIIIELAFEVMNNPVRIKLDTIIGPRREKIFLRGFTNNTGADQPAHPRSLISAFVIRCLESTICKLATGDISIH